MMKALEYWREKLIVGDTKIGYLLTQAGAHRGDQDHQAIADGSLDPTSSITPDGGPQGQSARNNVCFTSKSDRIDASQRTAALCQ
jgi:hypothetical protein